MNILHLDCSPRQASHSRALSSAIVARLRAVASGARVTRRDLGIDPLPHAGADYVETLSSPALLAAPLERSLDLGEALIGELESADVVVIGTPMHNFTVPSVLKAWIDQVLRVGRTMEATPAGKVGMLADRPVYIAVASGGTFTGERSSQSDFLTPYLSLALGSIGLKCQQFLALECTAFLLPDDAQAALNRTLKALDLTAVTAPHRRHAR